MPKRPRVIIIDDDPLFRSLIVSVLRKDFIVSVASEGSEGFHKALEHPPDVAVVDIQMPGWDGLQTLKSFRSHPSLRNVKILILTSDASKDTVLAAIRGGANDYVIKTDFSTEELRQKLAKVLGISLPAPRADQDTCSIGAASGVTASTSSTVEAIGTSASVPLRRASTSTHESTKQSGDLQELIDGWE